MTGLLRTTPTRSPFPKVSGGSRRLDSLLRAYKIAMIAAPCPLVQIDARNVVLALAQLLGAEQLQQFVLERLGLIAVEEALAGERSRYLHAVPVIQEMRNALVHFEDWSRGEGHGPQKRLVRSGADRRDVARDFWEFGYDPGINSVRLGPHLIAVDPAVAAANGLLGAIYAAAIQSDAQKQHGTI